MVLTRFQDKLKHNIMLLTLTEAICKFLYLKVSFCKSYSDIYLRFKINWSLHKSVDTKLPSNFSNVMAMIREFGSPILYYLVKYDLANTDRYLKNH